MLSLYLLIFIALLASIEDMFNSNFDILWIIAASCMYIATGYSIKYLFIGSCFVFINPFNYAFGAGDLFFLSIFFPFINDYLLFCSISSCFAIGIYYFLQTKSIPFLFPIVLGVCYQL